MRKPTVTLGESEKKALLELKESLRQTYGPQLKQTLLFGSKARGESTAESDIDVMVVLDNLSEPRRTRREILHISNSIDLKHDVFMSIYAVDADYFQKVSNMPFYSNVKAEGIPL